jgi:hypothetical protein
MVLHLKMWESRSLPDLPNAKPVQNPLLDANHQQTTDPSSVFVVPVSNTPAGWSSPVARQAHNLKVVSSNLAPATKQINGLAPPQAKPFLRPARIRHTNFSGRKIGRIWPREPGWGYNFPDLGVA